MRSTEQRTELSNHHIVHLYVNHTGLKIEKKKKKTSETLKSSLASGSIPQQCVTSGRSMSSCLSAPTHKEDKPSL